MSHHSLRNYEFFLSAACSFQFSALPSSFEHKLHEDRGLCLLGSQFEPSDIAYRKVKQVLEKIDKKLNGEFARKVSFHVWHG